MTKQSNICSSVEGSKLSFNTRQFFAKTPIIHDVLGVKVFPFKLGINGYVEVDEPLDDPGNMAVYKTSLTNKGDAIQGGSVDGWSSKAIKPLSVGPATGTHSASFGVLKGHSYAHVQSPHRDHAQSADIAARHPEIIQVINPVYSEEQLESVA